VYGKARECLGDVEICPEIHDPTTSQRESARIVDESPSSAGGGV
jgi:hypothetical protein